MKCRRCCSLVFDFLDGMLSPDDLDRIRGHLAACAGCSEFYEEEQKLAGFIHDSPALKALRYRGSVPSVTPADGFISGADRAKSRPRHFPFLKPALISCSLLAAAAVSYLVWFGKASPSVANSGTGSQKVVADLELSLFDPIRDWSERRLLITVTDSRGELDEAIVASRSPEKIVNLKTGERKK